MRNTLILLFVIGITLITSENDDLVVLVHGLAGNINSFEYNEQIERSGLKAIPVEVNGYTSNHDRACELYAQLKGTKTDYGVCHSRDFGHLRYGPDYTGKALYPEWDTNHRLHFWGHSMGGTTIRSLERLLEFGSGCPEDTSELFQGGNKFITSITTLASPLDGTSVFDIVGNADDLLINIFLSLGVELEDIAFPQWGLIPADGESFDEYIERLKSSGVLDSEDFSKFDLSTEGAVKFNSEVPQVVNSETYYFAFAAERTDPEEQCSGGLFGVRDCKQIEVPQKEMSFTLKSTGSLMGRLSDESERKNDGIVNQARARCPGNVNCMDVSEDFSEWNEYPGQWVTVELGYLDHYQVTDIDERNDQNNFKESALKLYLEHSIRLKELPSKSLSVLSFQDKFERSEEKERLKRYLKAIEALSTPLETEERGMSRSAAVFSIFITMVGIALVLLGIVTITRKKLKQRKLRESLNDRDDMEVNIQTSVTL